MQNNNKKKGEIAFNSILEEITNTASSFDAIPHKEVLKALLETLHYIDFKALANADGEETLTKVEPVEVKGETVESIKAKNKKVKKNNYHVLIIDELLKVARANHWNFCEINHSIYLYNGAFWKQITEKGIKHFLGKAAIKMGMRRLDAKHFSFKDNLLRQFLTDAVLEVTEVPENTVLINLQNGTFEITPERRDLRSFNAKDFLIYQLSFPYDENAKAPKFHRYLKEVLPDEDCRKILAEYLGYVFTRNLKLEKILLLYGSGANGKSVFFEIVNAILGKENVTNYALQSLTNESGYQRARLGDALVNYASEINGNLNFAIFKQLASGEPIGVRLPYSKPFVLRNYAKLIFNCNELPKKVEQTDAFFRRFLIIPFNVTIKEDKRDKNLAKNIIESELSGVFNWVLEGLDRLLENQGFTESKLVKKQLEEYRKESDSVQLFLDEYDCKKSISHSMSVKQAYMLYKTFCQDFTYKLESKINLKKRLIQLGYDVKRDKTGNVVYLEMKGN